MEDREWWFLLIWVLVKSFARNFPGGRIFQLAEMQLMFSFLFMFRFINQPDKGAWGKAFFV